MFYNGSSKSAKHGWYNTINWCRERRGTRNSNLDRNQVSKCSFLPRQSQKLHDGCIAGDVCRIVPAES
ncbi:hypothetical protein DAI22_06g215200 [Oryza sativa Japonica Group]|nr:hypothetical protein DAI22_06g215200 [Oryza sativa Japonica Group]